MTQYDPSMDDDIFDDDVETPAGTAAAPTDHNFDGKLCQLCGVLHPVHAEGPLPPEIEHEFDRLLKGLPEEVAKNTTIVARSVGNDSFQVADITKHIENFVDDWYKAGVEEAKMRGILSILDEMTDGRATAMVRFNETETRVSLALVMQSMLRNTIGGAHKLIEQNPGKFVSLGWTLDLIIEVIAEYVSDLYDRYIKAAQVAQTEPDELLAQAVANGADMEFARNILLKLSRLESDLV